MCQAQDRLEEQVGRYRELTEQVNTPSFVVPGQQWPQTKGATTLTSLRDLDDLGLGEVRALPALQQALSNVEQQGWR